MCPNNNGTCTCKGVSLTLPVLLCSSSRVQQLPQQRLHCQQGSPHTSSSSPVKVKPPCPIPPITPVCVCASCFSLHTDAPSGQILQFVRAPNGAQYLIQQPQQQILLQQQVQPGPVQAPVIQQVRLLQGIEWDVWEFWGFGSFVVEAGETKRTWTAQRNLPSVHSRGHLQPSKGPFVLFPGPDSSAGSSASANRSHHPAAANRLSFWKQSPRQHAGQQAALVP